MTTYKEIAGGYDGLQSEVDYEKLAASCAALFNESLRKTETVLDLACGTGSLLFRFAEMGFETIGTDGSSEMLSIAADKAQSLDRKLIRPLLLNQMMEELDLYGTVDAAVCTLDGLNYLDEPALRETFRRLALFIAPGGVLVFDVNTLEKFRAMDGCTFASESEDTFCIWRCRFEEPECEIDMDVFRRQGRLWSRAGEEHIEFYHSKDSVSQMLLQAGFTVLDILDGYPGALADGEGTRNVFLCRR